MKTTPSDRTGILIVRLWVEPRTRDGFRARITQTLDTVTPGGATSTAASPDDVYAAVRSWVETFVVPA